MCVLMCVLLAGWPAGRLVADSQATGNIDIPLVLKGFLKEYGYFIDSSNVSDDRLQIARANVDISLASAMF